METINNLQERGIICLGKVGSGYLMKIQENTSSMNKCKVHLKGITRHVI